MDTMPPVSPPLSNISINIKLTSSKTSPFPSPANQTPPTPFGSPQSPSPLLPQPLSARTSPFSPPSHNTLPVNIDPTKHTLKDLKDRITKLSGIPPNSQRLIYRGRLLNSAPSSASPTPGSNTPSSSTNNSPSCSPLRPTTSQTLGTLRDSDLIGSIKGLADGDTIHCVPRNGYTPSPDKNPRENSAERPTASASTSAPAPATVTAPATATATATATASSSRQPVASSTNSLLATLLGLTSPSTLSNTAGASTSTSADQSGDDNNNGNGNKIEDEPVPDLEHIRQGLLTMHTLLGDSAVSTPKAEAKKKKSLTTSSTSSTSPNSSTLAINPTPLTASSKAPSLIERRWYPGQWVDCRDTVNQWLEATVLDVVVGSDLEREAATDEPSPHASNNTSTIHRTTMDPAVSTANITGRNALLKNSKTDNAQLLLIHYNGWPQRWDEWIRSDSKRLRPFRTKTRHGTSAPHASPTPVTTFSDAPDTRICSKPEPKETSGDSDNERKSEAPSAEDHGDDASPSNPETPDNILPELSRVLGGVMKEIAMAGNEENEKKSESESGSDDDCDDRKLPWKSDSKARQVSNTATSATSMKRLASLFDRLGRLLTDSAVAVDKFSDEIKQGELENQKKERGDASGAAGGEDVEHDEDDATRNEDEIFSNTVYGDGDDDDGDDAEEEDLFSPPRSPVRLASSEPHQTSPLLTSNLNVNTRRSRGASDVSPSSQDTNNSNNLDESLISDMVNSTQSGNGSGGPSSVNSILSNSNASSLALYLAAASLVNGGGSGLGESNSEGGSSGVNVHIHAIVTPSGGGGGGIGSLLSSYNATAALDAGDETDAVQDQGEDDFVNGEDVESGREYRDLYEGGIDDEESEQNMSVREIQNQIDSELDSQIGQLNLCDTIVNNNVEGFGDVEDDDEPRKTGEIGGDCSVGEVDEYDDDSNDNAMGEAADSSRRNSSTSVLGKIFKKTLRKKK